MPDTATTYLHLPLAHTFGLQTQVVSFDHGGLLAYCADSTQILTEIGEVRPTYLPSVPRIYEKIYTLATEPIEKAPPGQLEQFRKAVEIGLRCERCSCGASRSR